MANLKNTTINDTGFLQLPTGTTAQRPSSAQNGQLRYNTNTGKAEFYNSAEAAWVPTLNRGVIATGGTVYDTDVEGTTYRVHVFTATGNSTFAVTKAGPVEYLIVAGGGGGGSYVSGGGGGGGGALTGVATVTAQSHAISVGAGGAGGLAQPGTQQGTQGQNSSAFGLTAIGGGFGSRSTSGGSGGSGGGGSLRDRPGGSGTAGQGNAGGSSVPGSGARGGGGGGGGAGSAGATAGFDGGTGGIGIVSTIAGNATFYAGGGSGGGRTDGSAPFPIAGVPGLGGGGQGGDGNPGNNAVGGTPNTGGGGGGGGGINDINSPAGSGASGIVIIRYPLRQENPVTAAGKTIGDGVVLDLDFAKPTVYAGTGTTVSDSRLNGVTGSFDGTPQYLNARTDRSSLALNGNSHIVMENSQPLQLSIEMTIEVWYYLKSPWPGGALGLVTKGPVSNDYDYMIYLTSAGTNWGIYKKNSAGSGASTAGFSSSYDYFDKWNHICYTVDINGAAKGYENAVLRGEGSFSNTDVRKSTQPLRIGRGWGSTLNGEIGFAKIYNRPLTTTEVAQQYNATRWRFGV